MQSLVALIQNTATISLAAVVLALLGDRIKPAAAIGQATIGLILGAAGMVTMAYPALIADGLYFDGRIVVAALSGPIGGPISAAIVAAMVGGMRLAASGPGAAAGVAGIIAAAAAGVALRGLFKQRSRQVYLRELSAVGAMAASIPFLSLPLIGNWDLFPKLLSGPIPITSATNFIGVVFSGVILVWDRDRRAMVSAVERAYRAANAANSQKTAFIAHLSHEFRSPLASIVSGLRLLRLQPHGPLGHPRYFEYAGMMETSAMHLSSLVDDVLDTSLIEAGEMMLRRAPVKLTTLVEEAAAITQPRADASGVALEVGDLPDCELEADARRIRQVLVNILTNGIRFTPAGGRVRVSAEAADASCRIAIADTGVGISPADQQRILQPFSQVENEINKKGGGTGLGLSLSKRLVELHGGRLMLASEPGQGASVFIELPLAQAKGARLALAAGA